MPHEQMLAQLPSFRLEPEHIVTYVLFTLAFLFLAWLLDKRTRPIGTSLILWGVLLVVLACGYGLIGVPTVMMLTPALAKVGMMLVLGGTAWSLLAACPASTAAKEAEHVQ